MINVLKRMRKYVPTVIILLFAGAVYIWLTENKMIDTLVFPSASKIGESFREFWPSMLLNILASFALLFPSLFLGIAIALGMGTVMGLNKKVYDMLHPIMYAISVVPALLLSPIALHVAESFRSASVFLIVYSVIWPTLFATITGIQTIDKRYLDNASTLELGGWKLLVKVVLPAALPSIMSGVINSLRGSFQVLVFAEMYGTSYGMGFFIKRYSTYGIYQHVWSGFLCMIVVLVVVVQIFEKVKNRMLRWTME